MKANEIIRETITDLTAAKSYNACMPEELCEAVRDALGDKAEEIGDFETEFYGTVEDMINQKELGRSGRGNLVCGAQLGYVTGTFRANAKGFGFVTPDARYEYLYPEDLFIGGEKTGGAMMGDTVMVRITEPQKGGKGRHTQPIKTKGPRGKHMDSGNDRTAKRTEAAVIRIITRALTHVTGTLYKELPRYKKGSPRYFVEPDNDRITSEIQIRPMDLGDARPGDKVEVEIVKYPKPDYPIAQGKITHVFGDTESKEANYEAVLRENGIRRDFSPEVLAAADKQASRELSLEGRLDLRDKIIFTIDSADAKDLDDAISLEKTDDGWLLGVHIADVGEYVRQNNVIDVEAYQRGTSVYFVDQVIPMLPKALSNGICSLNGGEDRYALSALISLDKSGNILSCDCRETVIRSKVRGVYAELNDILEHGESSVYYDKYAMLFPDVYPEMVRLYEILYEKNRAKGALELETAEPKFVLDESGFPIDIVRRERGISECLIEQFMLCANEAVASWLYSMQMPCIYRIHEEPPSDKMQTFASFAYNLGLDIRPLKKRQLRPADLQTVMNEAKEKDLDGVLSVVMLRSLSKARYARTQGIHFGLATEFYCHFTSPIRRYPDLCVHRFIKDILHGKSDANTLSKTEVFAEKAALQSTECEIRAMTAERDIEDLYKVLYLEDKVGQIFDGIISSVTSFGFFVELDNLCEGLVPIGTLNGYFNFDEKNLTLSCGSVQYKLGQRVRVEISGADRISRKVDMVLADEDGGRKSLDYYIERIRR